MRMVLKSDAKHVDITHHEPRHSETRQQLQSKADTVKQKTTKSLLLLDKNKHKKRERHSAVQCWA